MLKSLDKEWSEIEEMNAFFLKQNLKYFPLIKSIHLTNFLRISGDFIIPDDIHTKKYELFHPISLLRKFKFIKQIHVRKNGVIIEYEYLAPISSSPIESLSARFDSIGSPFLSDFSSALKEFHQFDLKQKKIKNDEKIDDEPTLRYFDDIFSKHRYDRIISVGNEIVSKSDFTTKYLALNNNMIDYVTIDEEIDYFSSEFTNACENLFTFAGSEKYINRIMEYFYNVMAKINVNSEINFPQIFKTFAGLHFSSMRIQESFFPKEKLMTFTCILEKSERELLFYNNILKAKMIKNHQLSEHDSAKKKIKRHNELIKLYYHKEQK